MIDHNTDVIIIIKLLPVRLGSVFERGPMIYRFIYAGRKYFQRCTIRETNIIEYIVIYYSAVISATVIIGGSRCGPAGSK